MLGSKDGDMDGDGDGEDEGEEEALKLLLLEEARRIGGRFKEVLLSSGVAGFRVG